MSKHNYNVGTVLEKQEICYKMVELSDEDIMVIHCLAKTKLPPGCKAALGSTFLTTTEMSSLV